jgi:hypothetical protein
MVFATSLGLSVALLGAPGPYEAAARNAGAYIVADLSRSQRAIFAFNEKESFSARPLSNFGVDRPRPISECPVREVVDTRADILSPVSGPNVLVGQDILERYDWVYDTLKDSVKLVENYADQIAQDDARWERSKISVDPDGTLWFRAPIGADRPSVQLQAVRVWANGKPIAPSLRESPIALWTGGGTSYRGTSVVDLPGGVAETGERLNRWTLFTTSLQDDYPHDFLFAPTLLASHEVVVSLKTKQVLYRPMTELESVGRLVTMLCGVPLKTDSSGRKLLVDGDRVQDPKRRASVAGAELVAINDISLDIVIGMFRTQDAGRIGRLFAAIPNEVWVKTPTGRRVMLRKKS